MSKLVNDNAFGDSLSSKFNLGDLVSWSEWAVIDNDITEIVYYGTIVDKTAKTMGGRPISVVMVACSKTGNTIPLSPFQLRLEETN